MARMVFSRLVQALPSLLGVTIIAFVWLHLSGDVMSYPGVWRTP